jgi:NTE family protein
VILHSIIATKYLIQKNAKLLKNLDNINPFEQDNVNEKCKNWFENNSSRRKEKYNFQNLVFQGAGVKGIGYVGALKQAIKSNIISLNQIKRVGGTSAGAIIACLIGIGCSMKEIENLVSTMKFEDFLDEKSKNIFVDNVMNSRYLASIFTAIRDIVTGNSITLLLKYCDQKGLFSGDAFLSWIEKVIEEKISKNATFEDCRNRGFKEMSFVAMNVSKRRSVVFSYETHPKMKVSLAVRMSMSIPGIFSPVLFENDYYVDGGVLDNYPIFLFDNCKYLSEGEYGKIQNPETLGFRMVPESVKNEYDFGITDGSPLNTSIFKYISDVKSVLRSDTFTKQFSDHALSDDKFRTIYIDDMGVSFIYFEISNDEKVQNLLKNSGKKAVYDFLDRTEITHKVLDHTFSPVFFNHLGNYQMIKKQNTLEFVNISLKKSPQLMLDLVLFAYHNNKMKEFKLTCEDLLLDIDISENKNTMLSLFLKSINGDDQDYLIFDTILSIGLKSLNSPTVEGEYPLDLVKNFSSPFTYDLIKNGAKKSNLDKIHFQEKLGDSWSFLKNKLE